MTTSKGAASRKGGGSSAAKAERNGKREMDFEGLKVTLPPKLPTSFAYRFAKITAMEERDQLASGEVYELLVGVIGAKQFDAVTDHVDTIRKDIGLSDLVVRLILEYGTEPGNSGRSGSS